MSTSDQIDALIAAQAATIRDIRTSLSGQSGTTTGNAAAVINILAAAGFSETNIVDALASLKVSASPTAIGSVAGGSTLGLEQALLANAGQPGLTVLVAGPTTTGKVQGTSLGDGNVVEVYANGADFSNNNVLYREFMALGEPICFTGLSFGAIITASEGFYGFTEVGGISSVSTNQGIMPLMSFGFSFQETFLFAFRSSSGSINDRGIVFVANGPLENTIKFTDGSGTVVLNQENIVLSPWEVTMLDTSGNQEYILSGNSKMMACILSDGGGSTGDFDFFTAGRQWDCRLVLPTSGDLIGNPRFGFMSAPYDNTVVEWYGRQGTSGSLNTGQGVSPGSPNPIDSASPLGTGSSLGNHDPAGYYRFRATGLISGYSGADGQGGDAVAFSDTSTLSQVIAQPLQLPDSGVGSETGVTIFSCYVGEAKIYEWDDTTKSLVLAYTLPLIRDSGITISSIEDQYHPCAASLSNTGTNTNNALLVGELRPGVIIANVPIGVVIQAQGGQTTMRSQNGTTVLSIYTQEDETASYGWTPDLLRAEIREGTDGLLYRREISAGSDNWVLV